MDVIVGTRTEGPWTVVEVAGELDLHTSPPLREHLLELIQGGAGHLALDLTKVDFMDSSSLGSLVTCLKRIRERDGKLVLVGVGGTPMKVLTLTGLDRVFDIVGSTTELPQADAEVERRWNASRSASHPGPRTWHRSARSSGRSVVA